MDYFFCVQSLSLDLVTFDKKFKGQGRGAELVPASITIENLHFFTENGSAPLKNAAKYKKYDYVGILSIDFLNYV